MRRVSPSLVASDWNLGETVPTQEPATELIPDHPEYEDLVRTWPAVPDGAHWAWEAGLEKIKALEEGRRSAAVLRPLVTKAYEAKKNDWRLVRQKMTQVLKEDGALTLYEMDIVLPLAFGRILGIRLPEDLAGDIWSDCW
ncbi:hypothetical protein V8C34DRAFT_298138 [Trichoderma compactum]